MFSEFNVFFFLRQVAADVEEAHKIVMKKAIAERLNELEMNKDEMARYNEYALPIQTEVKQLRSILGMHHPSPCEIRK